MLTVLLFNSLFGISLSQPLQDSSYAYLQRESLRIDSLANFIDNYRHYELTTVIGVSQLRDQYKGLACIDPKSKLPEKIIITPLKTGRSITVYLIQGEILKITELHIEYYLINKTFFHQDLKKVVSPLILEELADVDSILQMLHKIFLHKSAP